MQPSRCLVLLLACLRILVTSFRTGEDQDESSLSEDGRHEAHHADGSVRSWEAANETSNKTRLFNIAGTCKAKKPLSMKCGPTTTGRREEVPGHGWCCLCPEKSAWNTQPPECVCDIGAKHGITRLVPEEKSRKCPDTIEESLQATGGSAATDGAFSQVQQIRDYCDGRRTLEEFSPGIHAKYHSIRMGFDGNTALSVKHLVFTKFSVQMQVIESANGLKLQITNSEIHVSLRLIDVVAGSSHIMAEEVALQATVTGEESLLKITRFGILGGISVKCGKIQIGGKVHYNGKGVKSLAKTAVAMMEKTLEEKAVGSVVATICSSIVFNLRGVAIDHGLRVSLQGRNPYPLVLSLHLCDTDSPASISSTSTCIDISLVVGILNEADTEAALQDSGFAPQNVSLKLDTGIVDSTVNTRVASVYQLHSSILLQNFAFKANEAFFALARGAAVSTEVSADEDEVSDEQVIQSCNDPEEPEGIASSISSWAASAAAAGAQSTFQGVTATLGYVKAWVHYWTGSDRVTVPSEPGDERYNFERSLYEKWLKQSSADVIGIMTADRSKPAEPAFYAVGIRNIHLKINVDLKFHPAGVGQVQFTGRAQLANIAILGLTLDSFEPESDHWQSTLVNDWTLELENTVAQVSVKVGAEGRASACANIPLNNLHLKTNSYVDTLASLGLWLGDSYIKSFLAKAVEQALVSILKTALEAAPEAAREAALTVVVNPDASGAHSVEVLLHASSDSNAIGTLSASSAAVPPEESESAFGRAWPVLQRKVGPAPVGTEERLSYEPQAWLDVGLYKALDRLVPGMNISGTFGTGVSGEALVTFNGKLWVELDNYLRASLNDHGAWVYGDFAMTQKGPVKGVKERAQKSKEHTWHSVLSCGALYLLPEDNGGFLLRKADTAAPAWVGRFDLLTPGMLVDRIQTCDPVTGRSGAGGSLFEGHDPDHKSTFLICIETGSTMLQAIRWEQERVIQMRRMMIEDYTHLDDWSPVSWFMKEGPFSWQPDEVSLEVLTHACSKEVQRCAAYIGCMGVAAHPCTYLSSRDVVDPGSSRFQSRPFVFKKWQYGLPYIVTY